MSDVFDDGEAQAALDAVLAEPPFSGNSLGTEGVWLRLWQLLKRWYEATLSDMYLDNPVGFWVLMVVLSLVACVLIWHLSISLRDVYRSIRRAGEIEETSDVEIMPLSLDSARAALAGTDYRFAVELAWSTAAAALARRPFDTQRATQHSTDQPSSARTPRQQARVYRQDLTAAHATALGELVRAHEQACYEGIEPSAELAHAAVAAAAQLMETK